MYTITKEFSFCASHTLGGLPADHPCSALHGHNYTVIVELETDFLDETGFVVDYRKLGLIKEHIDKYFDHRHLNDAVDFNPTAANLAKSLHRIFKRTYPMLKAVTVKPTDEIAARYEG